MGKWVDPILAEVFHLLHGFPAGLHSPNGCVAADVVYYWDGRKLSGDPEKTGLAVAGLCIIGLDTEAMRHVAIRMGCSSGVARVHVGELLREIHPKIGADTVTEKMMRELLGEYRQKEIMRAAEREGPRDVGFAVM